MTSAQRLSQLDPAETETAAAPLPPFELKQQVAERLASHRARRGTGAHVSDDAAEAQVATPGSGVPRRGRSAQIAASVAQRYAQTPSYRAFLAAEAERSVQQAQAAAEVATINAQAIAMAQQQLMADLEHWNWSADAASVSHDAAAATASAVTSMLRERDGHASAAREVHPALRGDIEMPYRPARESAGPVQEVASAGFTVRLYEDVGPVLPVAQARRSGEIAMAALENEAEREALDEEIAFRKDPYFEEAAAPEPLPANLIEFPRQLVAARKARPRRAEGPLLDDPTVAEGVAQLRIFEVQPDQMSAAPVNESVTPEWTSIMLGALPTADAEPAPWGDLAPTLVPQTAAISLRVMSGLVDGGLIAAGTVAFLAAAVATHTLLTHGAPIHVALPVAALSVLGAFVVLAVVYLLLSFTVSDSTPGMRYARIGLCTFADENPSRKALRRRVIAMALSVVPVGLGFLWACLDEDHLTWHDRMSRMYQRGY